MRRYFIQISLVLSLLIILAIGLFNPEGQEKSFAAPYHLSEIEKSQLQTGDIILRRGYGLVSNFILRMMNEKYKVTHLGIIVNQENKLKVAHTLSSSVSDQDGLRFQSFDQFVQRSHDSTIIISRLKSIDSIDQQNVTQQLRHYQEMQLPFDNKFDYKDTTEHYCSELIWRIYETNLGILQVSDSLTFHKKYNTLNIFYDTSYFDIIINHQNTIN